jgi:hypothetical protein
MTTPPYDPNAGQYDPNAAQYGPPPGLGVLYVIRGIAAVVQAQKLN